MATHYWKAEMQVNKWLAQSPATAELCRNYYYLETVVVMLRSLSIASMRNVTAMLLTITQEAQVALNCPAEEADTACSYVRA